MKLALRGESVAMVRDDGAEIPVAGALVRAWSPGSGTYSGWYATWGAARLERRGDQLFVTVYEIDDTDGGLRDENHVVHATDDGGRTWAIREEGVPPGAELLDAVEQPKPPA